MTDIPPPPAPDEPEQEPENKLTSDRFEAFKDALETLYLQTNISGRLQFAQNWPEGAAYILGDELMGYDQDGASDKERRAELEQEADERRIELLEFMETVEEKSVVQGALQIDYVSGEIQRLGRPLALCVYGQKIVDRFLPGVPAAPKKVADEDTIEASGESASTVKPDPDVKPMTPDQLPKPTPASTDEGAVKDSDPALNVPSSDPLDNIKPIDMTPQNAVADTAAPSEPPVSKPAPVDPAQPASPPQTISPVQSVVQKPAAPKAQDPSPIKFVSSKDAKKSAGEDSDTNSDS